MENEEQVDINMMSLKYHKCEECGKSFSCSSNLSQHMKRIHSFKVKLDYRKGLLCPICKQEICSKKLLENHLSASHEIILQKLEFHFSEIDEFFRWKKNIESENRCTFIKNCGAKIQNGIKTTYYYCQRSGCFVSKSKGKRNIKLLSTKIEGACPSMMKCTEKDSQIKIEYVKTHLGHSCDIEEMRPANEEKNSIEEKISIANKISIAEKLATEFPLFWTTSELCPSSNDDIRKDNEDIRTDENSVGSTLKSFQVINRQLEKKIDENHKKILDLQKRVYKNDSKLDALMTDINYEIIED